MEGSTVKTQEWFGKFHKKFAPLKATICCWVAQSKCCRSDTKNAENSERPNETITPKKSTKLFKISEDISIDRVHHILHEYLGMRKLCSKWVPCLLTVE